jgi:hypothetical protein
MLFGDDNRVRAERFARFNRVSPQLKGLQAGSLRRRKDSAFLILDQFRAILDAEIVAGHANPTQPSVVGSSETPHRAKQLRELSPTVLEPLDEDVDVPAPVSDQSP